MKKIELLAPAKNLETAIAAINSGADAIYIGASDFGARKNAPNPLADIEKLVNYAHLFGVKIHVTINTILNNDELIQAVELVKNLYNIGVDAIIVQDMGLVNLFIKQKLPPIQIHISTQCDNRTLEKVKFFDNLGVSRVILARELSFEQICEICQNVNCEIETFIHGSLCVSYSGQCYLSYANGFRSANRGECAQPCRKSYSLVDESGKILIKDKYLLSLKDFNLSESIEKLISCGVKSFKIEGRLKDINYVKNVTLYYNNLINKFALRTSEGKVISDFEPDLYKTFNREYTQYFFNTREQCFNFLSPKSKGEKLGKVIRVRGDYFVIEADISPQDGLCFVCDGKLTGFLVNKVIGNKIYPAKMPKIMRGDVIYRNFNSKFDKILKNSKTSRKLSVKFSVDSTSISVSDNDNTVVTLEIPPHQTAKSVDKIKDIYTQQLSKTGQSPYLAEKVTFNTDKIPFLPISEINNIRRKLLSMLSEERLRKYKRIPQKPINYSSFPITNLDYRANIFNNEAQDFYQKCGCSVCQPALEVSEKIPKGIELMRTKHCLKYALNLCGKSCKKLYLKDEKGKTYPLRFDCKNCEMVILSP